jgi:hypothetical protein
MVVVQSRRGQEWRDFSIGPLSAAARLIEVNPPGIWRAIDPLGNVVIEPRTHQHAPLFGVCTDGVATCECGQRITQVGDQWRTNWPPREDREAIGPLPLLEMNLSHDAVADENLLRCSCGWDSGFTVHPENARAQFRRHLQRVGAE